MHHLSATSRRRFQFAAVLATGTLLASMFAGCSSSDGSDESEEAGGLASACSNVDLAADEMLSHGRNCSCFSQSETNRLSLVV